MKKNKSDRFIMFTILKARESLKTVWETSPIYLITTILVSILNAFMPVISASLMKRYIYIVENNSVDSLNLLMVIVIMLITEFSLAAVNNGVEIIEFLASLKISDRLYKKIVKKMRLIPYQNFEDPKFHDDISKASRFSSGVLQNEISLLLKTFTALFKLLLIVGMLFKYSIWLVVFTIIPCGISSAMDLYYRLRENSFNEKIVRLKRKVDYFEGSNRDPNVIRDYRVYDKMEYVQNEYKKHLSEYSLKTKDFEKYKLKMQCSKIVTEKGFIAIDLIIAGFIVINSCYRVSDFLFLNTILRMLMQTGISFLSIIPDEVTSNSIVASFKKIMNINERNETLKKEVQKISEVEFKDVSFTYPNSSKKVLNNISFTIKNGGMMAIIGKNGAGKSTIVKLMLGLYAPTSGEILINGVSIKEYKYDDLLKRISVIFQDYAKYPLTVMEQISLGNVYESINKCKILSSIKKSGVDDFVFNLENGIDQELTKEFSKEGVDLSGGQWQRLSLAKAFYKHADILVLDEPAASLDPYIETSMFECIESMNNIRIIISHRLANIKKADKIIFIEDGKIVGQGNHEELLSGCAQYKKIYMMQVENYIM